MAESYKLLHFLSDEDQSNILIAELGYVGFDSFLLLDNGLEASIPVNSFDEMAIRNIAGKYKIPYKITDIKEKNWNKEWEKNYDPILVDNYCLIKASFHKDDTRYPLEITINPKMSFGTGHHDTTYLMVENEIKLNFKGKTVLDAGCGTGILSIVAEKLGASEVTAFDMDSWSYENTMENIQLNTSSKIVVFQGDTSSIPSNKKYDIILANINLNIILDQLEFYSESLNEEGIMVLSGFLLKDENIILQKGELLGLTLQDTKQRGKWLSMIFNNGYK
jgi:ribosomal protein L11 methyltransferase